MTVNPLVATELHLAPAPGMRRSSAALACAALVVAITGCTTTAPRSTGPGACTLPAAESVPERRSPAQRIVEARRAHASFRQEVEQPLPQADTMVLIMLERSQSEALRYSIIGTRSATGTWQINRLGKRSPNLIDARPTKFQTFDTVLQAEAGRALDRMLADPCLYREPPRPAVAFTGPPVDQWSVNVAIITPRRTHAASALGPLPGITGEVVTTVSGW
jgi:hypothetical protein